MNSHIGAAQSPFALTPRRDRIEAAIEAVLRAGGTRSELRDLVYQFADLSRLQGLPIEHATARVCTLGEQAAPQILARGATAVGDSPEDRVAMMGAWCIARYERGD